MVFLCRNLLALSLTRKFGKIFAQKLMFRMYVFSRSIITIDEPSPTPSPTPSVTPTPLPTTPTVHHTPTPTPQLPRVCSRLENSGSEFGFFDWPETAAGERVERACPHGPEGGVASRECGEMGEWGAVEGGGCAAVSQTTLELVAISQVRRRLGTLTTPTELYSYCKILFA